MKIKIGDIFIAVIIIFVILTSSVIVYGGKNSTSDCRAIIIYNNVTETVSLNKDRIINKGNIEIEIKNGYIFVAKTNCRDKICLNTGKINKKGQSVICVPNKLIIKIEGRGNVDAIAD